MFLLALSLFLALTPPVLHTPQGDEVLKAATNCIAVETSDPTLLQKIIAEEKNASVVPLFQNYYLLDRITHLSKITRTLIQTKSISNILASYYSLKTGQRLISDGYVLARFPDSSSFNEIQEQLKKLGIKQVTRTQSPHMEVRLKATSPKDALELAHLLHQQHIAIWAIPDFIYKHQINFIPSDTYINEQWHHKNIASEEAWEYTQGDPNVIIAVLDSGADMSHPDLKNHIVSPYDTLDNDNNPQPNPTDAHGTGTLGLAGAQINNNLGVAGVCGQCSMMPIRIMTEQGFGRYNADSDAFYWAQQHGAFILSNSWGPEGAASIPYNLEEAIRTVSDGARNGKGAVILFASGNDSRENQAFELASHPLVLGVGATNYWDTRESYSDWGNELDITAPAASVTTDIQGSNGYARGDYMGNFNGTSAACPVAAGVVGLIFSMNPNLTRGQAQSILLSTADKIGSVRYQNGFHPEYGQGRVNAYRAMQAVAGDDICQPNPENCTNNVDDDCDGLIDIQDPNCAPTDIQLGSTCEQSYTCGQNGFCIPNEVFPNGYCSVSCSNNQACPHNGVCLDAGQNGQWCLQSCTKRADCRSGYDCLQTGSGNACLPSCTVSGCQTGETCNTTTGQCEHNGASFIGGACTTNQECSNDGFCLTAANTGRNFPGGYCTTQCSNTKPCDGDATCLPLGRFSLCADTCMKNSDCRANYSCWPTDKGVGICWASCTSDNDCENGETCNQFGLCGADTPPRLEDPVVPPTEQDPRTSTCTGNDCNKKKKKSACEETEHATLALSLAIALALARKQQKAHATLTSSK